MTRMVLDQALAPAPRLCFTADAAAALQRKLAVDSLLHRTWRLLRQQADAMLAMPPLQREQRGRRLLHVSRAGLKRISYLAFAHRLTGDRAYLERAEREMLALAAFPDWNPSHFLDAAEMTTALAIGYDWLRHSLGDDARATIRDAIVTRGLEPGLTGTDWWVTASNNWSQVCHAGLTLGALAVMDEHHDLSQAVITRALEHIHRPMDVYGPNGAYPEGPGYWEYGTSYNVLFIDALRSALGTDFGLSEHEAFLASADYFLHVHGPTTRPFNYSDNQEALLLSPAMAWFARRLGRPDLMWLERRKLEARLQARAGHQPDEAEGHEPRLLPFLLIWAEAMENVPSPAALHYVDRGHAPIGIHRSGWDEDAVYVGLKAGRPRANHGHLDIGSFVMEADGVRWAVSLGVQDYHSLESAGLNLWNMDQDSDRWRVFRLHNRSKNTLLVNDAPQRVDGFAAITAFADDGPMPHTIIDMTEVYANQLAGARRGVGLRSDGTVVVQDELTAGDTPAEVRWGMVTRAEVELVADDAAVLREAGKQLGLHVLAPPGARLEIYDTATPRAPYDAPNPGTRMIGFKRSLNVRCRRAVPSD